MFLNFQCLAYYIAESTWSINAYTIKKNLGQSAQNLCDRNWVSTQQIPPGDSWVCTIYWESSFSHIFVSWSHLMIWNGSLQWNFPSVKINTWGSKAFPGIGHISYLSLCAQGIMLNSFNFLVSLPGLNIQGTSQGERIPLSMMLEHTYIPDPLCEEVTLR